MCRRQRQVDELRRLCRSGAVARAVDLAFAHFADYGRDDDVVALLAEALDRLGPAATVRRHFAELTSEG